MDEHEFECGNKTELCEKCNFFIQRKGAKSLVKSSKIYVDREAHIISQCYEGSSVDLVDYTCPICLFGNLHEGELIEHIKAVHSDDTSTVVGDICVAIVKD